MMGGAEPEDGRVERLDSIYLTTLTMDYGGEETKASWCIKIINAPPFVIVFSAIIEP